MSHVRRHPVRGAVAAVAASFLVAGAALVAAPAGAADAPVAFFPSDDDTLAIFEFNGDVLDSSGNGRDAMLLDPSAAFVPSTYGQGLVLPGDPLALQGIDWSAFAGLLTPPYTIELLVQPDELDSWSRLFTHDRGSDAGLYYFDGSLQNYPDTALSGVVLPVGELHCLAWSAPVEPAGVLDLYLDGEWLGQVGRPYATPTDAWFLQDNTTGSGVGENLVGHVDAMRISDVARTPEALAATCEAAGAGEPLVPPTEQPQATAPQLTATGAETGVALALGAGLLAVGATVVLARRLRRAA